MQDSALAGTAVESARERASRLGASLEWWELCAHWHFPGRGPTSSGSLESQGLRSLCLYRSQSILSFS